MKKLIRFKNGPSPRWFLGFSLGLLGMLTAVLSGCRSLPANAPPSTGPVDLSGYTNGILARGWHPETQYYQNPSDNHLAELPQGTVVLGGTTFDIRGVIQLAGTARGRDLIEAFPAAVKAIPVGRKVSRFVFLHGTGWQERDGTVIGHYTVNYAGGQKHPMSIVYGKTVRDWWFWPSEPETTAESELVWKGSNPATLRAGMSLRLYKSTFENPFPDDRVVSIDFVSTMTRCAPFLIALSTE